MQSHRERVTVSDIWRLALPSGTRLLAGEEGLCHPVEWVAALRAVFPLLGNLREGYVVVADLSLARQLDPTITHIYLLDQLQRAGASGLIVREALPKEACEIANANQMPLLLLPSQSDLHEIERDILRTLVDREGQLARRETEARRHLQTVMERHGSLGVITEIARLTGRTVVLTDATGIAVQRAGPQIEGHADVTREAYAVRAAGRFLGEVALYGSRACSPADAVYARQAAELCAPEIIENLARLETEERLGADLVQQILNGHLNGDALTTRLIRLGYDASGVNRHVAVAVAATEDEASALRQRAIVDDLTWAARQEGIGSISALYHHQALVLASFPPDSSDRRLRRWLADSLATESRRAHSVGVSRAVPGLSALPAAIRQSLEACDLGLRLRGHPGPHYYEDLGLYRLLTGLRDQAELRRFYEETLGTLSDYDAAHKTDLVHTLDVLLQYNGNASSASRALYIHRNTLSYRLDRIAEITGMSLADPDTRLALQLALAIRRISSE